MKRIKPYLTYLMLWLGLLLTAPAWALNLQPEAETFLWKVERGGQPVSYLLGTIHVGVVGARLSPSDQYALGQVSQLVVESDADELQQPGQSQYMAAMLQAMQDNRPLQSSMGRVRLWALNRMLQGGQEPVHFAADRQQKPWVVWSTVQSLHQPKGYSYQYGVDNLLLQAARAQGKPIRTLEKLEGIHYIAALPEDKILRSLDSSIRHNRALMREQADLVRQYRQREVSAMMRDVADFERSTQYLPRQDRRFWYDFLQQKLLIERNQAWLPQLVDTLPKQSSLVAVGTAHLFGEQGLIQRLRQLGYRVSPVLPSSQSD